MEEKNCISIPTPGFQVRICPLTHENLSYYSGGDLKKSNMLAGVDRSNTQLTASLSDYPLTNATTDHIYGFLHRDTWTCRDQGFDLNGGQSKTIGIDCIAEKLVITLPKVVELSLRNDAPYFKTIKIEKDGDGYKLNYLR